MLDQRPRGCRFESSWLRGSREATVGQLLFAPGARAYSALHPFRVGKGIPATAGKRYVRRCLVRAMNLSASAVAVSTYGRYNKMLFLPRNAL